METAHIPVSGMECDACVGHVTKALKALEGVASVAVSLSENRATVQFDPTLVSPEQLRQAIDDEGYEAAPLQ